MDDRSGRLLDFSGGKFVVARDPRFLSPGDFIGPYKIDEVLGSGGMGMVFSAQDLKLQRLVAIKVLYPEFAERLGGRERFLREGRAAARLRHPNVVYVLDLDVDGELAYFVMEYMVGESLRALMQRVGTLSVAHAVEIVAPIAWALSVAHRAGIVHRDIKPENIVLAREYNGRIVPKIVDFGIARLLNDEHLEEGWVPTATGTLLGTPHYMSPEQVRGASLALPASDQYSLGVVLYEMLTNRKPFDGDSLYSLLSNIVSGEFPPARELRPDLSPAICDMIRRALHFEPKQRFSDCADLAVALEQVETEAGVDDLASIVRDTRLSSLRFDDVPVSVEALDTPDTSQTVLESVRSSWLAEHRRVSVRPSVAYKIRSMPASPARQEDSQLAKASVPVLARRGAGSSLGSPGTELEFAL